jgi:hypothetical protein
VEASLLQQALVTLTTCPKVRHAVAESKVTARDPAVGGEQKPPPERRF